MLVGEQKMKTLQYIVGESYREPMIGLNPMFTKEVDILRFSYVDSFHYAELRFVKLNDNTRVPPYRLTEIFDKYERKGMNELRVELKGMPDGRGYN